MNEAFFKSPDRPMGFGFAVNPLDRVSERREDEAFLGSLRARPDARALLICRDTPILKKRVDGLDPLFPLSEIDGVGASRQAALLGLLPGGAPVFAFLLDDGAVELRSDASDGFLDRRVMIVPGRGDLALIDMRSIAVQGLLAPDLVGMLGQAKALMHWHTRHSHCANCGAVTRVAASGWRRECDVCKAQHFPRTDPVVIMLAVDGDNCLLGRQARFPKSMYSCLAGFLEPGETIEDAVRREIFEEAGIVCGSVSYLASQPWPFPASLMIGCIAQATTLELHVDGIELEDARWFSRAEAASMLQGRHSDKLLAPHPMAIAHHILRAWTQG
ncbi:NAD(+) diphosphatase [Methylocapsa sp. S129]|uniref:NAD(+) diphosphatase n=1 Tax=Methylocapsa sp. S129 TaxID=1641869 RepID=UPI001FF0553E|nr:NAD(+) diphosphatase [Methylocapsa sp. S129]